MDYNRDLINIVRNSPYLYDRNNKDYKKGRSRVELWHEVSKKLIAMGYHTSGEKCRERWNCLKGRFVKERNTMKRLKLSSSPYVPRFSLYSALKFVEPHLAEPSHQTSLDYPLLLKNESSNVDDDEDAIIQQSHHLFDQNNAATLSDANSFVDHEYSGFDAVLRLAAEPSSVTVHALKRIPLVGTEHAQVYPLNDSSFTDDPFVTNLAETISWCNNDETVNAPSSWLWYVDELLKSCVFHELPEYKLGASYSRNEKLISVFSFVAMLIETNLYLFTSLPINVPDVVPKMLLALYTATPLNEHTVDDGRIAQRTTFSSFFDDFVWPCDVEHKPFDWDKVSNDIAERYPTKYPESPENIANSVCKFFVGDDEFERQRAHQLVLNSIGEDVHKTITHNMHILLNAFRLIIEPVTRFCERPHHQLTFFPNPFVKWRPDRFRLSCVQIELQHFRATIALTSFHQVHMEARKNTAISRAFLNEFMFSNIRSYSLMYEARQVSATPIHEFTQLLFIGPLKKQLEVMLTALNLYQDNGFKIAEARLHGFNFSEDATAQYFPICQLLSPRFCQCLTEKAMPELYAALRGFINGSTKQCHPIDGLNPDEQLKWIRQGEEARRVIESRKCEEMQEES